MPVVPPLQSRSTGALTSTGLRSPRGLAWIGRAPEEGAGSPSGTGSFAFSQAPRSSGGLPAPPLTEAAGQGGCPPLPAWWPPAGQPLLPPRLTPQVLLAGIKRDKLCRALILGPGMSLSIP